MFHVNNLMHGAKACACVKTKTFANNAVACMFKRHIHQCRSRWHIWNVIFFNFEIYRKFEVHVKNSAMFQFQHDAEACACKNENVKERCRLHVKTKPAPLSFAILQLLKYVYRLWFCRKAAMFCTQSNLNMQSSKFLRFAKRMCK